MRGQGRTTGLAVALGCVVACGSSHAGHDDGSGTGTSASGGMEKSGGTRGSAGAGLGGSAMDASGGSSPGDGGSASSGDSGAGGVTGGGSGNGGTGGGTAGQASGRSSGGNATAGRGGNGGSTAGIAAGGSSGVGGSMAGSGWGSVAIESFPTPMIYLIPRFNEAGRVSTCTQEDFGNCTVFVCMSDPVKTHPDAGTVSVSMDGEPLLTTTPDVDGVYPTTFLRDSEFAGGELLTISAAGGEVPAFDGMVEVPAGVRLSKPEPPTDGTGIVPVPRDQELVIEWTGGTAGVFVNVQGSVTFQTATTLSCTVASEAGSITIPAETLELVAPLRLQAFAFESQPVAVEGYAVTVNGVLTMNASNGDPIEVAIE